MPTGSEDSLLNGAKFSLPTTNIESDIIPNDSLDDKEFDKDAVLKGTGGLVELRTKVQYIEYTMNLRSLIYYEPHVNFLPFCTYSHIIFFSNF